MNKEREIISFDSIFRELQTPIENLYNSYNYITATKEQFISLCNNILLDIYYQKNKSISNNKYIELLKKSLDEYVKKELNDPKIINKIIKKFINKNIKIHELPEENIEELRKIYHFLIKYEVEQNPELYSDLLNYKTINKIIDKIVKDDINIVTKEELEMIVSNHDIMLLLEIYCEKNQINLKNNTHHQNGSEDYNSLGYKSTDSIGMYLKEIARYPVLSSEEEKRLFMLKEQGDTTASQKIMEHNLKLVVNVAKHYAGKGMDLLDVIQEGNLGLNTAIEKFDYKKGYKFSTYATWWIRQSIQRSIMNNIRIIRLPVHICEKISKYTLTVTKLEKKLQRTPTREEICEEMKISKKELSEIEKNNQNITSINVLIGPEGASDTELGDLIASDEETLEEQYFQSSIKEEVMYILERINLTDRERNVIIQRNGLEDGVPKTLEDVGKMYGITRERVRQIEARTLRKIRYSPFLLRLAALAEITPEKNMFVQNHIRSKKNKQI